MRRVSIVLAGLAVILSLPCAAADVTLEFLDHLGPDQIEETIVVTFGDRLVGTLAVSQAQPESRFTANVEAADRYAYRLCGELKTRGPDGAEEVHPIDTRGELPVPPGATLAAFNVDAKQFYLAAMSGDRVVGRPVLVRGHGCSDTVAMR